MKVAAVIPAEQVNEIPTGALVRVVGRTVMQVDADHYRVEFDIRPWDTDRDRAFVDRLVDEP